MDETGRQRSSPWREGFLFIGNQLALDFLNTRPIIDGKNVELLTDFHAVLRWFEAAGLLGSDDAKELGRKWGDSAAGRAAAQRLRSVRELLRNAVVRWEAGEGLPKAVLEALNRLMAEYPLLTRLTFDGRTLADETWFRSQTPEGVIAPIAHSAAMLFATADRGRVRMCGNCVLHFLDTSKKRTRRWCSMDLCGNRLKVAAYAGRQRSAKLRESQVR